MSEQQRDTAFLTRLISYDDSDERHNLAAKIARLQNDERCVKRAAWLMVLFAALATAGISYAAVFLLYPTNIMQFLEQPMIKILSAVALSSLICLLAFQTLAAFYRMELARHREQCRCLAMKILESRLSRPVPVPLTEPAERRVQGLNPALLSGI
jgi:hypothetical protein